jgi:transcriptional regulator with GAF, ATPase, and Fis domain
LYDSKLKLINFPYVVDKVDASYDSIQIDHPSSIAAMIIRSGEPVFMTEEDINEYAGKHNEIIGFLPKIFIGVPLKIGEEVIGAMCLQLYDNPFGYKREDLNLLKSVSDQVALAIERKRASINLNSQLNFIQNLTFSNTFIFMARIAISVANSNFFLRTGFINILFKIMLEMTMFA